MGEYVIIEGSRRSGKTGKARKMLELHKKKFSCTFSRFDDNGLTDWIECKTLENLLSKVREEKVYAGILLDDLVWSHLSLADQTLLSEFLAHLSRGEPHTVVITTQYPMSIPKSIRRNAKAETERDSTHMIDRTSRVEFDSENQ
jgi:thymidylate kinase